MIVAFSLPAMGHTKPMMPLLKGLIARSERVVCFGHRKFEAIIRASGATFEPYPDVPYDIDRPDFNLVRMAADLIRASETIVPALQPRIKALAPRLILQDFMALWASRIGSALGIPRIQTVPTIVFNREAERQMRQEDGVFKLVSDVVRGAPTLARELVRSRFAVTVREAFGLERCWCRLRPPIAEIVFSLEEFQAGSPHGDVARHYIGPSYDDPRDYEPTGMHGYALITFGTLSNNDTGRFEAALRGSFLAGRSAVVVCGGSKVDIRRLEEVGRSLQRSHPGLTSHIIESVPALERWICGAAVVVHHAGTSTTWETVRYRKPALFIPTIADQKVFASLLAAHGYGIRLPRGCEHDAQAIARGINEAMSLDDRWDAIERRLRLAGGAAFGAEIVLAAMESGR